MEDKKDIIKKLNSNDVALVKEAIEEIKREGDLTIVPELLELLLHCPNTEIVTPVTTLLSDIKDSNFKQLLIDKLASVTSDVGKSNLLRICWESAIDFSEYLDLFVDILVKDDFISALEASTVIENLSGNMNNDRIRQAINRLNQTSPTDDKAFLIEDTLHHLEELLLAEFEEENTEI